MENEKKCSGCNYANNARIMLILRERDRKMMHHSLLATKKKKKGKKMENRGIDPLTSRMRSGRSTI